MLFNVILTRNAKKNEIIFDSLTERKEIETWLEKIMYDIAVKEMVKLKEVAESLEIRIMQKDMTAEYNLICTSKFKGHPNVEAKITMQQYEVDLSWSICNQIEKNRQDWGDCLRYDELKDKEFYLESRTTHRVTNKISIESILEWFGETYGTDEMDLNACATGLCQYIFEHGYKLGTKNCYELQFMHNGETHYFCVSFNMTNVDRLDNLGKNAGKTKKSKGCK